ncbi:deoxyxylulose-5-phosphate synthase [Streptomyces coffeae]|uniref:Deoxyxylulose-5-phosphate synthase n=1 Tax=Streptomyces coffeae TaxID=621382 RepID=A0ABS1NHA8_9ACTN|nr:deoxyxylulose-5-phosphate synthase [Streptomyces coffeae]MBL1099468.1 deoxyxylulose-5-phosphate synthase [Streptomyces coffeae]
MPPAKTSYVCLPCRASYKQPRDARHPERRCPRCAEPLIHVGAAFAPPPRRDTEGWRTLSLLLHAGIRFPMGCCGGPGYRPRTMAEVRERMAYARDSGEPLARALVRAEVPWSAPSGRRGRERGRGRGRGRERSR